MAVKASPSLSPKGRKITRVFRGDRTVQLYDEATKKGAEKILKCED